MQKDLIQKGIFENILYVKQVYKHSAYNLAFPSPDKTFLRQPIYSFTVLSLQVNVQGRRYSVTHTIICYTYLFITSHFPGFWIYF